MDVYEKYKNIEDLPVKLKIYKPEGKPAKGIIQFHHGMSEHSGRYGKILKYMSDNGYICAIYDMRGHGSGANLGYFGENGAELLIEDAHAVTAFLKNKYPDLPLIFIGHSFGSLVARAYIKKYDYEIDRLILSGSPSDIWTKIPGMLLIELITVIKSDDNKSGLVSSLFTSPTRRHYRKYCKERGLEYKKNGYLCTDEKIVDSFNSDVNCGFMYTLNGYYTIMEVMTRVYNGSTGKWALKNKNLPITFLSGGEDIYRVNDRHFLRAVDRMKKIGYANVDYKLYEGMYHEIFNEVGCEEVYEDILRKIDG